MTTADRIRQRRLELGLTQLELAKRMGLTSKAAICKIEKQGNEVTLKNIEKIALALNCAPSYLMGWSDEKYDDPDFYKKDHTKTFKGTIVFDARKEKLKQVLEDYDKLSDADKELINNMIKSLASKKE